MVNYLALIVPIITLLAGILILAFPNMLRYLVGIYLLLIGIISLVFVFI